MAGKCMGRYGHHLELVTGISCINSSDEFRKMTKHSYGSRRKSAAEVLDTIEDRKSRKSLESATHNKPR